MSKPALDYRDQLDQIKSRGLIIPDEPFALHVLEHHNYYRLASYRHPFTVAGDADQFRPGTTFTQLWNIYQFDHTLQRLVLSGCRRVEISARSRLAYEMGHEYGPQAYQYAEHFTEPRKPGDLRIHANLLDRLKAELDRSKEEFVHLHRKERGMNWPPLWVLVEVVSFGSVSLLLSQVRYPSLRQRIAVPIRWTRRSFVRSYITSLYCGI